jgi:hypothetical protein
MALSDHPAERHRQVGQLFTDRVRGTQRWNVPSPVADSAGRDIVRHLTQWLPGFLSAGAAIELPSGPSVDDDPVTAWQIHCAAVQALLDDPATTDRVLANPHIGALALDRAIDQFYIADVLMHGRGSCPGHRPGRPARPRLLCPVAGRDGADGRGHPVLRPVRGEGRGARRCRPADQAAGIHRPRSLLDTRKDAAGVSVPTPPSRARPPACLAASTRPHRRVRASTSSRDPRFRLSQTTWRTSGRFQAPGRRAEGACADALRQRARLADTWPSAGPLPTPPLLAMVRAWVASLP